MERQGLGVTNAYILNLMVHSDTLRLNEYDLRNRIEKYYKRREQIRNKNKKEVEPKKKMNHIRPQNVKKFHLEPLVRKRWLRLLPDGNYERIGELRRVKPRETLFDQFSNDPELQPFIDSYIHDIELKRNMGGAENYEDSLTEQEYKEYLHLNFID